MKSKFTTHTTNDMSTKMFDECFLNDDCHLKTSEPADKNQLKHYNKYFLLRSYFTTHVK